jgi:hypothetical protein
MFLEPSCVGELVNGAQVRPGSRSYHYQRRKAVHSICVIITILEYRRQESRSSLRQYPAPLEAKRVTITHELVNCT